MSTLVGPIAVLVIATGGFIVPIDVQKPCFVSFAKNIFVIDSAGVSKGNRSGNVIVYTLLKHRKIGEGGYLTFSGGQCSPDFVGLCRARNIEAGGMCFNYLQGYVGPNIVGGGLAHIGDGHFSDRNLMESNWTDPGDLSGEVGTHLPSGRIFRAFDRPYRNGVLIASDNNQPPRENGEYGREQRNRIGDQFPSGQVRKGDGVAWLFASLGLGLCAAFGGVALETDHQRGPLGRGLGAGLGFFGVCAMLFGLMGIVLAR